MKKLVAGTALAAMLWCGFFFAQYNKQEIFVDLQPGVLSPVKTIELV